MWTTENRARYNRDTLRYPSAVTEEEWAEIAPLLPPARRGGRRRTVNIREVFNGLLYVLSTGCQWRAIPQNLPPRSTIFHYFGVWEADGTLRRIQATLYGQCREEAARSTSPTACIIDSQSVKSAEKGGVPLIRRALTRANGATGKSATCESLPWGSYCRRSCIRPTSKIVTEGFCCSRRWRTAFRSWPSCLRMGPIKGRSFATL